MNRGSVLCHQYITALEYGFNEAPIHESGKCDIGIVTCDQAEQLQ